MADFTINEGINTYLDRVELNCPDFAEEVTTLRDFCEKYLTFLLVLFNG